MQARLRERAGSGGGRDVSMSGPPKSDATHHRPELHEPDRADGGGRSGHPVDLHEQRDRRDLVTGLRDELADPQQPEVARLPQRTDVDGESTGESEGRAHERGNRTHGATLIPDFGTRLSARRGHSLRSSFTRDAAERYSDGAATGRRSPRLHRGVHRGHDQLPRLPRRQLGRPVLAPEGLHAGVHDRARLHGEDQARVRQAQREDPRPVGRPARRATRAGPTTSKRRRGTRRTTRSSPTPTSTSPSSTTCCRRARRATRSSARPPTT